VAANRDVNLLGLCNAASLAVAVGAVVWTPVFFQEARGAGPGIAAYITAGLGLSQLLGNPLGALAAGRWGARPVMGWSLAALAVTTALVPATPSLLAGFVLIFLVGFFDMSYFAPMFAAVPRVVDLPLVGLASAWVSIVGIAGSLLAPWLFGLLLDAGWGYPAGYLMLAAFAVAGLAGTRFLLVR
jgi:MFS family permease